MTLPKPETDLAPGEGGPGEGRERSDPRRADIVEPEEEENEKKDTRRDTGFKRETDTDSQYIDYSYTYNPICLRCKMHRFCPKDRVPLVTASLEERGRGCRRRRRCRHPRVRTPRRMPAPILLECFTGSASRLRLDPPRIAPFRVRLPRAVRTRGFLPRAVHPGRAVDLDFAKRDPGGRGRSDFSTNGARIFPPMSSVRMSDEDPRDECP